MDSLFSETGGCGWFQVLHATLVQSTRFAMAFVIPFMVFGAYNPGWTCLVTININATHKHTHNYNHTYLLDNEHVKNSTDQEHDFNFSFLSKCPDATKSNGRSSSESNAMRIPMSSLAANDSDGYGYGYHNNSTNQTFLNYVYFDGDDDTLCDCMKMCDRIEFNAGSRTIVSEFGLVCDKAIIPSIILCIQMVGMLFGSTLGGQIGERFGRKASLYSNLALCSLASLLAIWSPSWQIYSVIMFFNGFGSGGVMCTNIMFTMEFLEPKWRGRVSGFPSWNVAVVVFALCIVLLKDWVYIHIAASCVCTLSCLSALWVSESLRWLMVHGKEKRAKQVIRKIVSVNRVKDVDVDQLMTKLSTSGKNDKTTTDRKFSYLDLFRDRYLRFLTIKLSVISFFTFMSYYALSFSVKSLAGDFYLNVMLSAISEIPFVLIIAPMTNIFGRRKSVIIFLIAMALGSATAVVAFHSAPDHINGPVIAYSAFFAKGAGIACMNTVFLFAIELYPTAVRNLGVGFITVTGALGNVVAPFLIPHDQNSVVESYNVVALTSIVNVVLTLRLRETKDQSLQDTVTDITKSKDKDIVELNVLPGSRY